MRILHSGAKRSPDGGPIQQTGLGSLGHLQEEAPSKVEQPRWLFLKIGGFILGVPIIRFIVAWDLVGAPDL